MACLKVDARESKLIKHLTDRGESFVSCGLPLGDVLLLGSEGAVVAVIERKTIADLIMSIKDSRYSEQKKRLGMSYPRSAIMYVIESESGWDSQSEMIKGAIINTMLRDDIKVFMTQSVGETCSLVCDMMARIRKDPAKYAAGASEPGSEYSDSLAQVASAAKKRDQMDQRTFSVLSLSLVPGVSKVIAKTVVDAFGNINEIISAANAKDLANLKMASGKRLGPTIASRIVYFLSPPPPPKNVNDIETVPTTIHNGS